MKNAGTALLILLLIVVVGEGVFMLLSEQTLDGGMEYLFLSLEGAAAFWRSFSFVYRKALFRRKAWILKKVRLVQAEVCYANQNKLQEMQSISDIGAKFGVINLNFRPCSLTVYYKSRYNDQNSSRRIGEYL